MDTDHQHGGVGYDSSAPDHNDCAECGRNMDPLGELHTADCPSALRQDIEDDPRIQHEGVYTGGMY